MSFFFRWRLIFYSRKTPPELLCIPFDIISAPLCPQSPFGFTSGFNPNNAWDTCGRIYEDTGLSHVSFASREVSDATGFESRASPAFDSPGHTSLGLNNWQSDHASPDLYLSDSVGRGAGDVTGFTPLQQLQDTFYDFSDWSSGPEVSIQYGNIAMANGLVGTGGFHTSFQPNGASFSDGNPGLENAFLNFTNFVDDSMTTIQGPLVSPTFPSMQVSTIPGATDFHQPDLHSANTGGIGANTEINRPHEQYPSIQNGEMASSTPVAVQQLPQQAGTGFRCTSCNRSFGRNTDRIRHETALHGVNQRQYLCQVPRCIKGQDGGYSRADKLKEHMWKKHANLGYVKGRM